MNTQDPKFKKFKKRGTAQLLKNAEKYEGEDLDMVLEILKSRNALPEKTEIEPKGMAKIAEKMVESETVYVKSKKELNAIVKAEAKKAKKTKMLADRETKKAEDKRKHVARRGTTKCKPGAYSNQGLAEVSNIGKRVKFKPYKADFWINGRITGVKFDPRKNKAQYRIYSAEWSKYYGKQTDSKELEFIS